MSEMHRGAMLIWKDGYKAAMVRVETCLLAGDLDRLYSEVTRTLVEKRGRKPKGDKGGD